MPFDARYILDQDVAWPLKKPQFASRFDPYWDISFYHGCGAGPYAIQPYVTRGVVGPMALSGTAQIVPGADGWGVKCTATGSAGYLGTTTSSWIYSPAQGSCVLAFRAAVASTGSATVYFYNYIGTSTQDFFFAFASNQIYGGFASTPNAYVVENVSWNAGDLVVLVCTYNESGSGVVTLYVNGVLSGSVTGKPQNSATNGMVIGNYGPSANSSSCNHPVLYVAWSDRAFTAGEIGWIQRNPLNWMFLPDPAKVSAFGGSVSPSVALTAVAATGTAAAMTPQVSVSLAAASSTGAVAGFTPQVSAGLAAATATGAAAGTVPSGSAGLSGVATTGAVAGIVPQVSVPLTAAAATGAAANFGIEGDASVSLIAASASGTAAALTPQVSVALGTASSTGASAALGPSPSTGLTATTATAGAASVGIEIDASLAAVSASGAAANVTATTGGNVNVSLTGVAGLGATGSFVPWIEVGAGAGLVSYNAGSASTGDNDFENDSIVVTPGTAPRPGDLMIVTLGVYSEPSGPLSGITDPGGWTTLDFSNYDSGTASMAVLYKIAGGSEPPTYTFSINPSQISAINSGYAAYGGVDPSSPINVSAAQTYAGGGGTDDVVAPSVSPTIPGGTYVGFFISETSGPLTAPAGTTSRYNSSVFSAVSWTQFADQGPIRSGPTGTYTATGNTGDNPGRGVSIVLTPGASGFVGASALGAAGAITASVTAINVPLAAASATGSAISFAPSISFGLAAAAATGIAGRVTPTVSKSLTGVAVTGAVAAVTVTASISVPLSAVSATGAAAALTGDHPSYALASVSSTALAEPVGIKSSTTVALASVFATGYAAAIGEFIYNNRPPTVLSLASIRANRIAYQGYRAFARFNAQGQIIGSVLPPSTPGNP